MICAPCIPVSPLLNTRVLCLPGLSEANGEDERVDPKTVMWKDPIVGVEEVTYDQRGPGAREAQPLPSPKQPSEAMRAKHNLTHFPYESWCPHCVACKRPNSHHRRKSQSDREIPLLVGDYGFIRDSIDKGCSTILVLKLYPYGIVFSSVVHSKGPDPTIVDRMSKFMRACGLAHFAIRSDREPSIVALMEQAAQQANKKVTVETNGPAPVQAGDTMLEQIDAEDEVMAGEGPALVDGSTLAVPELTMPGESQSNGKAERAVRSIEDQVRTLKAALETHISARIPVDHPVMEWIVEHAAFLINRYVLGTDGRTAYGRLHGREVKERIAEFGEKIMWYVPKRRRVKLDVRWRYGTFLGRALHCDQNYIGLHDGTVTCARAIVRVVPTSRWDFDRIQRITDVPTDVKTKAIDQIEETLEPHANADDKDVEEERQQGNVHRLKVTIKDLKQHGFTTGCPRCTALQKEDKRRARSLKHSEACRQRVYNALRTAGSEKIQNVDPSRTLERDRPERPAERRVDGSEAQVPAERSRELEPIVEPRTSLDDFRDDVVPDAMESENTADPSSGHQLEEIPGLVEDVEVEMDNDRTYDVWLEDVENSESDTETRPMAADDDDMAPNADEGFEDEEPGSMMYAIMDNLQTNGVSPTVACKFAADLLRKSSVTEVYGRGSIIEKAKETFRSLNIEGLNALDLRTHKPNGQCWNFDLSNDRKEAKHLVETTCPEWLILSPPCTMFCLMSVNVNHPKMDPAKLLKLKKLARQHLHFALSLARLQMKAGRHFLFEQPATATSWKDPGMVSMAKEPRVDVVVGHQCQYGCVTTNKEGFECPALKPTKWMSNSPAMLARLDKKCPKNHKHAALFGKRLAQAAFYPEDLVLAILRGIRDTEDAKDERKHEYDSMDIEPLMAIASKCSEVRAPTVVESCNEQDLRLSLATKTVPFKYDDGRTVQLKIAGNYKDIYKDEYTGEALPTTHIHEAIINELVYLNQHVWEGVDQEVAKAEPGAKIISARWVNCNKRDVHSPDVRARYVAQEVNQYADESFYAATPPLEAKRMLVSQLCTERTRDGKPLKLSFIDAVKAYFNGTPNRNLFIRLPPELGLPRTVVGRLRKCIYGTRDAGAIWEAVYTDALISMGFAQGKASPCCFYHDGWKVSIVVHGDDFTALGNDDGLSKWEAGMAKAFEVKLQGRLGPDPGDKKEVRILNRILRWSDDGISYEADPRHVELLSKALGLGECRKVTTPGAKLPYEDDEEEEKSPDVPRMETMVAAVMKNGKRHVSFKEEVESFPVRAYSDEYRGWQYGNHPRNFVVGIYGGKLKLHSIRPNCDRFTGRSHNTMDHRKYQSYRGVRGSTRTEMLHSVLCNGAAWEEPTAILIAAVSKKKKFKPKRVGSKAAKAYERLQDVGEILTDLEATDFRSLSARANYLALDRPDIAYATKELCREFSRPTRKSLEKLKRLVRYLVHKPRLVWKYLWQQPTGTLTTFVDTDFAGCVVTRRSTSGGMMMHGGHLIRHWSNTQSTVTLSSAEAELVGVCKGASHSLGMQAVAADLGFIWSIDIFSDAAAAIGICRRRGLGKVRHLAVSDLWVQDRLRSKDFTLEKVAGAENPADILTKNVARDLLEKHTARANLVFEDGRAASAPTIDR